MKLDRITFTGACDTTNIDSLIDLQKEFPHVEWGILLSENKEGNHPRYPGKKFQEGLLAHKGLLNLSGHLCGRWTRELVEGNFTYAVDRHDMFNLWDRMQLNFYRPDKADPKFYSRLIQFPKEFIFQYGRGNPLFHEAVKKGIQQIWPLFDRSGGRGVEPTSWPKMIADYCGYAGGLGPDNLKDQLPKIEEVVGDKTIWIDFETKVRSSDDRTFELGKIRECLEIAKPWVEI